MRGVRRRLGHGIGSGGEIRESKESVESRQHVRHQPVR